MELGLPIEAGTSIIHTILDARTNAFAEGEAIEIWGMDSFKYGNHRSYIGRIPKTGAEAKVNTKKRPVFKVETELGEAVNANTWGCIPCPAPWDISSTPTSLWNELRGEQILSSA